jgi:hypothetical protein
MLVGSSHVHHIYFLWTCQACSHILAFYLMFSLVVTMLKSFHSYFFFIVWDFRLIIHSKEPFLPFQSLLRSPFIVFTAPIIIWNYLGYFLTSCPSFFSLACKLNECRDLIPLVHVYILFLYWELNPGPFMVGKGLWLSYIPSPMSVSSKWSVLRRILTYSRFSVIIQFCLFLIYW